jgi:tetratricopeptide (TPR) repeat protein
VVGLGALLVIKRPWVRKPPPLVHRLTPGAEKPIDRAVDAWKLRFVDELKGTSAEFAGQGEIELARDTNSAYLDAEESFQKALVLDKSNDRAIAGWALAMAFGRGANIDDELGRAAEELLSAAEQRSGASRVYTAHAHLLLARSGNLNDIQVMAERGKATPNEGDKALALLALGQSMITKNPQYASEHFAEALKLDPKLKRAYLAQSQLQLSLGQFKAAIETLDKRLELDPGQWDAADTLARTWLEVGELAKAKQVYEKARAADTRNFRARLALAVLAYQHENDLRSALAQFDAIAADEAKLEDRDLVEALGHRAAARRLAGDLAGAAESADKAIGLKSKDPHVNLQRFLIALEQGQENEARAQWPHVQGKLGDPALELALERWCTPPRATTARRCGCSPRRPTRTSGGSTRC